MFWLNVVIGTVKLGILVWITYEIMVVAHFRNIDNEEGQRTHLSKYGDKLSKDGNTCPNKKWSNVNGSF